MVRPLLLPVALAAAMLAGPTRAAEPPAPVDHSIKAPHYGDALFLFFQDQYFNALTTLMVSQHFQRVGGHEDEAEVLRGGLLLSYGMHREAGEVFTRLIEQGAEPAARDRAWFFLAKVRYTRGDVPGAQQALARIERPLVPTLETERGLLAGQVQLAQGQNAEAAASLTALAGPRNSLPIPEAQGMGNRLLAMLGKPLEVSSRELGNLPPGDATLYARFNLGVALIRSGDLANGIQWLDELGQIPAATEEQRALRDQANLALGFAALQNDEPENARKWLERVRLNGPASNKALLGFGWAATALKKPRDALLPWTELAGRDRADPAVLEARIALPYALAEIGADAQALSQYRQALDDFQVEDTQLTESIQALRTQPWLQDLLTLNPGQDMGWFKTVNQLPSLPHVRQLVPALASHAFQEGFKNHRDVLFLQANLAEWQDKLGSFDDMLANRQKAFATKLPQVQGQAGQVDVAALQARQAALTSELAAATEAGDGVAFADPRQRDLLTRLSRARGTVQAAGDLIPAEEQAALQERIRLISGALNWELAQALTDRRWQAEKSLKASDAGITQVQSQLAALRQAQKDEAQRFTEFGQRIAALRQRIQALQSPLQQLAQAQAQGLQALLIASLEDQQQRLAAYSTQARFAMAQLHDQSRLPKERTDAAPR